MITSADTARRADEAEDQCEKGSEDDPVGDAEAGGKATVHDAVARHGKENDLDDPSCEGNDEREARDDAHEDDAGAMVDGPIHANEESDG